MKQDFRTVLLLAFFSIVLGACATCSVDDLYVRPVQSGPANHSMVTSLRPTLSWTYTCKPVEFVINLWTNSTNGSSVDTGFGGPTGSSNFNWAPSVDLTPGEAYVWSVAAKNGTTLSPYSPQWEFIVGPACGAETLIAPDPVSPITGSANTLNPTYIWDYTDPACTPEGYALQVSSNNSFTAMVANVRLDNPIKAWSDIAMLSDCTRYYWRVAAIDGPDDGPWSTVETFRTNAYGNCICLSYELAKPFAVWPASYAIVPDLQPVLEWSYPGSCQVEGFGVHLSTEHDMSNEDLFGGTGTPSTRWTSGVPLEPHTQYWWEVFAGVGTDFGEPSSKRSFFTGPECSPFVAMVAPELLSPIDGEQVTEEFATLRYTPGPGGCIPDGYFINLQTQADFGGTNLLGEFFLPGTTVLTEELEDCTVHYWKAAVIQDGVHGPESPSEWFYTNQSGLCPAPVGPVMATPMRDLACYFGPGREYARTGGFLLVGEWSEVLGRNRLGDWLAVADLDGFFRCWLPEAEVETTGDPTGLRELLPPTPEPTEVPAGPVCRADLPAPECTAAGGSYFCGAAACSCYCPK